MNANYFKHILLQI